MRILLVCPNWKLHSTYLPIGLGYIADASRKAGHEVSIMDARIKRISNDDVIKHIQHSPPDVIGLTGLHKNESIQSIRDLGTKIRGAGIDSTVVLGGPLASTLGDKLVGEGSVDIAVVGEGELTFTNLLKTLGSSGSIEDIPGIIFRRDGEVVSTGPGLFLDDLDDCVPAWDLLEPKQYFTPSGHSNMSLIKKSQKSVPIFTSRGCPFGCWYCHNMFGRKYRTRSAQAVLDELAMLKREYGIREIEIVDDCFNLDLQRAKEIAKGMIERDFDFAISFPNGLRADRMDEELIDLLKEAGTYRIYYAIETASPRLQKLIHKNVNLERTEEVITYTAKKGIMTSGFFMMGFPTETEEELRMTRDYALRSRLHQAYFFYVNPFPGTPLAEKYPVPESDRQNIEKMEYHGLKVNLSEVPNETLQKICKQAYRRFHFAPDRMWRTFRVVPKNLRTAWCVAVVIMLSLRDSEGNW